MYVFTRLQHSLFFAGSSKIHTGDWEEEMGVRTGAKRNGDEVCPLPSVCLFPLSILPFNEHAYIFGKGRDCFAFYIFTCVTTNMFIVLGKGKGFFS